MENKKSNQFNECNSGKYSKHPLSTTTAVCDNGHGGIFIIQNCDDYTPEPGIVLIDKRNAKLVADSILRICS